MREPEQVDQVIAVCERIVPAVLDLLKGSVVLELRIKLAVFIDVFFVLDFALIRKPGKLLLMLALQLIQLTGFLIRFLLLIGFCDRCVVLAIEILVKVGNRVADKLAYQCSSKNLETPIFPAHYLYMSGVHGRRVHHS